ncbi:MAG TPA: hypothetical protein VMT19_08210 [Thermoanaerobaculaceae bacterium]|nr:hypothetical protein [Thermoanaerobaculaceae bacterium]
MNDRLAAVTWLAACVALVVAAGVARPAEAPKPCCFSNERFAGVCQVVPENDETCEDILTYLNTPNSTGRTYCGATDIRGGWARVKCGGATPTPSGASGGNPEAAAPRGTVPARPSSER